MNKYSLSVRWSDEDEGYIATSSEFPGVSAFGETVEEAIAQLQIARKLAIETYQAEGWPLPEPHLLTEYSGKVLLRMPKSLHGRLVQQADMEGVSLNTLLVTILSEALGLVTGASRAERVLMKMLQGWNISIVRTVVAMVRPREVASETTRISFGEERLHLSQAPAASSQVIFLQQGTESSSARSSR